MAPKKNKGGKNGYFYFLMDLRKKMDFSAAEKEAARQWPILSAADKEYYNGLAQKSKGSTVKMTALQENLPEVQRQEDEKRMKEIQMKDYITKTVKTLYANEMIHKEYFHIMHINNFFITTDNVYYPGEIGLLRFNFERGVIDENVYHSLIRPGKFPMGYLGLAKTASQTVHKLPYLNNENSNMEEVCRDVFEFLSDSAEMARSTTLPPIYVKDDFRVLVENVMLQFANTYGYDDKQVRVFDLSFLLFTIRNEISGSIVWPTICQAINELDRDVYDYTREIPCQYHKEADAPIHCSRSHVIRMSFILCDNCCTDMGIKLIPGQHLPLRSKVDPIQSYAASESSRTVPGRSYAPSTSNTYRTNLKSLDFNDQSTTSDDQYFDTASEVQSESAASTFTPTVAPSQSSFGGPKTNWRDTKFGQMNRGRGRGSRHMQ